jgi:hypothetical protein
MGLSPTNTLIVVFVVLGVVGGVTQLGLLWWRRRTQSYDEIDGDFV